MITQKPPTLGTLLECTAPDFLTIWHFRFVVSHCVLVMDAQRGCRCRGIICGFCACFPATHGTVTERPLNLYWTGVRQRQVRNAGRASFLLASQPVTDAAIAADTVLAPSYTTIWLIPQAGPLPSLHRSGSSRSPRATFPPLPPKRVRPQTTDHGQAADNTSLTTCRKPSVARHRDEMQRATCNVPASQKSSKCSSSANPPVPPCSVPEKEIHLESEAIR